MQTDYNWKCETWPKCPTPSVLIWRSRSLSTCGRAVSSPLSSTSSSSSRDGGAGSDRAAGGTLPAHGPVDAVRRWVDVHSSVVDVGGRHVDDDVDEADDEVDAFGSSCCNMASPTTDNDCDWYCCVRRPSTPEYGGRTVIGVRTTSSSKNSLAQCKADTPQ